MSAYGSIDVHNNNGDDVAKETTPLMVKNGTGNSDTQQEHHTNKIASLWSNFVASLPRKREYDENDPIESASLYSQLVFGWMRPILEIGNKQKYLDPQDLDVIPLPEDCATRNVGGEFDKYWQREETRAQGSKGNKHRSFSLLQAPSLFRALCCAFGLDFARAGLLKLVHDLCIFVGPQVLNGLIQFLRDANAPMTRGLGLTLAVTLSQLTMSFCLRHYFFKCYLTGLRIRTSVVVAVYQKALRLSSGERQSRSLGELTNLMSIDAQRMQDLTTYLHAIWYSFIQIGLALFFLWGQLGASCLGGVAIMCVMMPVTKAVAQWMGNMQKRLMKAKDIRVNKNSEVLGAMKVIKLQAWEESFQKSILELRDFELKQLFRYIIGNSISIMIWGVTPLVVALATFAAYVLSGHQLDVATALTSLALFDILRFPLFMLPQVINRIVEASVSLQRINSFLVCEEHKPVGPGDLADIGVEIEDASYAYESRKPKFDGADVDPLTRELAEKDWEVSLLKSQLREAEEQIKSLTENDALIEEEPAPESLMCGHPEPDETEQLPNLLCLKRVNFECNQGQFIAVVGGIGCGKSSMLNAILGEVKKLSGSSYVRGNLSYFSQSPFIMNATLRDNVLFGHVDETINEKRYQRALTCCALRHDLELLPAGDMEEIGEKGITLSGGQRARVSMARAVYHAADICLLDDPLAAVDAHVGSFLFEKCIVDELLLNKAEGGKKRTVILVTNALQYLSNPLVDKIVVLNHGRVAETGTFAELRQQDSIFARYLDVLAETGVSQATESSSEIDYFPAIAPEIAPDSPSARRRSIDLEAVVPQLEAPDDLVDVGIEDESGEQEKSESDPETKAGTLMTDEFRERETGHVGLKVYLEWARAAGGYWVPLMIVVAYGTAECMTVLSKWWLTYWSNHAGSEGQMQFLGVYALINFGAVIAQFGRVLLIMLCGLRASRKMFARLLDVVLRAPMAFFDTTPIGRIINRFSKDCYVLDEQLMTTLRSYLATLFNVFSTLIVISSVTPMFLVFLVPLVIFYISQQEYFTATYRELKRLDSINRSPLYALLGETIDGVATIRSYGAQNTLSRRLRNDLDKQQHAYFLTCSSQCWLAVRLELVGTLVITFACLCSVLQHGKMGGNEIFAGLAGLAISYSLSVTQSLNWAVRMSSDFEANMVSVERIEQYCKLPSEAPRECDEDASLSPSWPSGQIDFIQAKLRYRPGLPLVLKGLDIHIPARSKVGCVGRTGAGKSTLMSAVLRIVELDSGKILIDGVDIRNVGLAKLRSKIAVIPQDPVLFSGTIRTNLDPFEEYSDSRLYDVLRRVGLYSSSTKPNQSYNNGLTSISQNAVQTLHDAITEGGQNLSVGQRQLLVIARALLHQCSIVIMDEATAAIDAETDSRIQGILKTEFVNATCITVAHRINTIMHSDLILVMNNGMAAEFDTPKALLERGGMFAELVEAAAASEETE